MDRIEYTVSRMLLNGTSRSHSYPGGDLERYANRFFDKCVVDNETVMVMLIKRTVIDGMVIISEVIRWHFNSTRLDGSATPL